MKFNVAKCHSMRVTRLLTSNQMHFNCSLHQQTLEKVQSAIYVRITITDELEWGQHVSDISSTKTLGFLRHLGIRRMLHTKQVRPQLEYVAPIWHPNDIETERVEKVQRT